MSSARDGQPERPVERPPVAVLEDPEGPEHAAHAAGSGVGSGAGDAPAGTAERAAKAARPAALRAQGLCAGYGGGRTLDGVDLHVQAGEHVAVLGPSGSGKTTLLACLASRLEPQRGTVAVEGRVATIHQDLRLVRQSSALANVLHGSLGRRRGWAALAAPKADVERAVRLLNAVGLGHRVHQRVSRLSGGEQQRVAIARALMQDPAVLLADEPVASLDEANAQAMMALLGRLCRERGLALVTVLHDSHLASTHADRVLFLRDGVLCDHCRPSVRCERHGGCESGGCETGGCETGGCESGAKAACVPAACGPAGMAGCAGPVTAGGGVPAQPTLERAPLAQSGPMVQTAEAGGAGGASNRAMRGLKWAGIALAVVGVYAWSISGLNIRGEDLASAGAGAWAFAKQLWPSSAAQITGLPWGELLGALVQTVQMALVGTTIGVLVSAPLAAAAARNLGPRPVRWAVRGVLNVIRTVPSLLWALVAIAAVGFGPLAGVVALAAYSVGYLTKFFYEAFEAVDGGPQRALAEIGAGPLARFVHAVWPAALPAAASSCLFMLEYNVRAASILGIVDAGGIGTQIKHYLDYRNFPAAMVCLGLILAVVIGLDAISTRVRAWAVGRG